MERLEAGLLHPDLCSQHLPRLPGHLGNDTGVGSRQPGLSVLLLGVWTLAIVLIIDIDRPQSGQVRISPAPLVWTLQGFGPAK